MPRFTSIVLALPLFAFWISCAEETDGDPADRPRDAVADQTVVDSDKPETLEPVDASSGEDVKADTKAPAAPTINEISAKGAEWIEIYNPGATLDVSGFMVADREKDGGTPKLSEAVMFPKGTTLPAKGYLLVGANLGDAAACPSEWTSSGAKCFLAVFGISNKDGETIFFLDAKGTVIAKGDYPPSATDAGQSWARLPNGTGAFAIAKPTPGQENQAN